MISGIGIGYRRALANELTALESGGPDFLELAPENWMSLGGYWKKHLLKAAERYKFAAHGLSLSVGSPDDLDENFLKELRTFLDDMEIELYSEHLSFSRCSNAHLYELLPIPFRPDAVDHIVDRIQKVQDSLKRRLVLENVSYYTAVAAEMKESEFISSIVKKSGCGLLLDVNNVFVNAFNHGYDARNFISELPLDSVAYIHMAGHEKVADDLIIDTHDREIIDPVYELFEWTIARLSPLPVLLERDFNIPAVGELMAEVKNLRTIVKKVWNTEYAA